MTIKLPGTCESCRWSTIRRDDPPVGGQFGYICEIPECRNRVVVHSWTCCAHYEPKPQPVTLEEAMSLIRDWRASDPDGANNWTMRQLHQRRDNLVARDKATKEA